MRVTLGDHPDMSDDLDGLEATYSALGVEVIRLKSKTTDSVFHRDVAAWTPFGLVKARMGKPTRAWEPDHYFEQLGIKPAMTVTGGHFEGADLIWLDCRSAVVATGSRTGLIGAGQVARWLRSHGARVTQVSLPGWHDQHLLGVANVLRGELVTLRKCLPWVDGAVPTSNLRLCDCDYRVKGPNWVTVRSTAVIGDSARQTIWDLQAVGLDVEAVPIDQLLKYGGGVACATGVLEP